MTTVNFSFRLVLLTACLTMLTSAVSAEDYVSGQHFGLQKCARAILGGYEVKGISVFGHRFNCKPIAPSGVARTIRISHDQFGLDDRLVFSFHVNSRNEYVTGTLRCTTTKGISANSLFAQFDGTLGIRGLRTPRTYADHVHNARTLRGFRGRLNKWERAASFIVTVVIAELGNPENRGVTPKPVNCRVPTGWVHDNYRGSSLRMTRPDRDLHDNGFGDKLSSICVPRGWTIRLYEHKDFKGRMLEIAGPKQYEDLKRQLAWGDRASSIAPIPPRTRRKR